MQQGQEMQEGEQGGPQLSPEGSQIVSLARIAMTKPGFKKMFDQGLKNPAGPSFSAACANIVFLLMQKGQEQVGQVDSEELYSDGGVGDTILAVLFKWLEHHGYEQATDPDTYDEALDIVENMGVEHDAQTGNHPEPDDDQQDGPSDQDQDNAPGNAGPPPLRGGLMA
jgi:hypothetical protein